MKHLISLILLTAWISGVVFAKGFLSTFVAVIFPLWAYYLTVERLVIKFL